LAGRGTVPGSENTALEWDMASRKTTVLKSTTWKDIQRLSKVGYIYKEFLIGYMYCVYYTPARHCSQDDPADDHIVRVENCPVRDHQAGDAAGIPLTVLHSKSC